MAVNYNKLLSVCFQILATELTNDVLIILDFRKHSAKQNPYRGDC